MYVADKNIEFNYGVMVGFTAAQITDLLSRAFERDSTRWAECVKGDYKDLGKGTLLVQVSKDGSVIECIPLFSSDIIRGLKVMHETFPSIFRTLIGFEDGDWVDGKVPDIFLQLCLFGEILYN